MLLSPADTQTGKFDYVGTGSPDLVKMRGVRSAGAREGSTSDIDTNSQFSIENTANTAQA